MIGWKKCKKTLMLQLDIIGDWVKIWCLQEWNWFKNMHYIISEKIECLMTTFMYFSFRYFDFQKVCHFSWRQWMSMRKGSNDVRVHLVKKLVGHAHILMWFLCNLHTIVTHKHYTEQNSSILKYSVGSFITMWKTIRVSDL